MPMQIEILAGCKNVLMWQIGTMPVAHRGKPITMDTIYKNCIEACNTCATACEHCATSCLTEADPASMSRCIRLDRYCADLCRVAAAFMARADKEVGQEIAEKLCVLCAEVCDACAAECSMHDMQHCQECAVACQRCAQACREMVAA